MKCEDVEAKLSWYLDGEAPELEEHLSGCEACRGKLSQLMKADRLLGLAAEKYMPEGPARADRIVSRLRSPWTLRRSVLAAAALFLVGIVSVLAYVNSRTADPQEVYVFGAERLLAASPNIIRVVVHDGLRNRPVADAAILATLGSSQVTVRSGPDGSAEIRLDAPDEEGSFLTLDVRSPAGTDRIERKVILDRPVRILLSTDKPLYQPTQTIHIRALALNNVTMKPYVGPLTLEVEDSKGNRVYKRPLTTSEFGVTSVDFVLADEVNFGTYRVRALAGGSESERTVEVKRYVLPKFTVALTPDRGFYAPGDTLLADLDVQYTFGKPVADSDVTVELSKWVGTRFQTFATEKTKTDARGKASIETRLEGTFFGTELSRGDALVRIEASITDGAGHVERKAVVRTVAKNPLRIQVFPRDGGFVEGVSNEVYVVASYPDGTPAEAWVSMGDSEMRTDETGVLLTSVPQRSFTIKARDASGRQTSIPYQVTHYAPRDFAIRTDRASYRAGETMTVSILSQSNGPVYVDLVKAGQTLLTKTVEVRDRQGTLAVDLPADLFGTIRVSAYRIMMAGHVTRASRPVVVDLPRDLEIRPTLKKDVTRPGEEIEIDFEVLGPHGKPVTAALGLSVVDEAVFALNEARPGLEKVYFQIEEELLKPKWQLKPARVLTTPEPTPIRMAAATVGAAEAPPIATVTYTPKARALERSTERINQGIAKLVGWVAGISVVIGLFLLVKKIGFTGKYGYIGIGCAVSFGLFLAFVALALMAPGMSLLQGISREYAPGAEKSAAASDLAYKVPGKGGGSAPRIREFFPETLYWNPQLITDASGKASVTIPGADSITTWRMAMSAVTRQGELGGGQHPIRVFQPFFVDLDLPVALTEGDEIWLPVAIYNYLKEPQTIDLSFEPESGFEVVGETRKKLEVQAGDVTSVRFHVRALAFGTHKILVKAIGTQFSDAVRRSVRVLPDGKEMPVTVSDRLTGESIVQVNIPETAVDGASRLWVRLFPSTFSEVVTGLEGLVRMPYG